MNTRNLASFEDESLPAIVRERLNPPPDRPTVEPLPERFFARPPQPAAVLMPLILEQDGWHLVLIRRACNAHDRHSGEVALPGGRIDPGDAGAEAAALREAAEEIGLTASNVRLLGRLSPYRSVSNFHITPVVGQVRRPFEPRPDPREVARVFSIPLAWLADPANLERRPRRLAGTDADIDVLHYRPYDGELLWGVTARLVASFIAEIIGNR